MKSANSRGSYFVAGALALVLTLTAGLAADPPDDDRDAPGLAPPDSRAYGKTLTEWLSTYWRWYYTGADLAHSKVGKVQLMPLPADTQISGTYTLADPALLQGQLAITLPAETPFVLPLFAFVYERYDPSLTHGQPDDVPINNAVVLESAHPLLTIDGHRVVTDCDKDEFFVTLTPFAPIVVYPAPTSYGSIAALSFQSVGVVGRPLSVGTHVLHLYEPLLIPAGTPGYLTGLGVIYDNTWTITVTPPRGHRDGDRD